MLMATRALPSAEQHFELRFAATQAGGHDFVFPCDEGGHVDLNALNEHDKVEYLFARALVGRDLARPVVVECGGPPAQDSLRSGPPDTRRRADRW